jgi:hypothetical protein
MQHEGPNFLFQFLILSLPHSKLIVNLLRVFEMNCVGMEKFPSWGPGRLNAGAKVGITLAFNFPRCEHFL